MSDPVGQVYAEWRERHRATRDFCSAIAFGALIDAAIALAWSESGTEAKLLGQPDAEDLYEPWPEMDALVAAIDAARPGWRVMPPPRQEVAEAVLATRDVGAAHGR